MDTSALHKGLDTNLNQEEENKKKGLIASIIFHFILMILVILPLLTFPDPPPGQAGVLVSFGEPDVGQGEEEPAPAAMAEEIQPVEEPAAEPEEIVEREVEEPKEEPQKPKKNDSKKINTDDNSRELALKRKKEKEKKAKESAEKKKARDLAKAKKAKADAEAKKKAAAAKKKADAEAKRKADAQALKDKIAGSFGGGTTTGSQGNSATPGNAGNPDGDPNAKRLEGLGKGKGNVSGFGDRGFARPSPISGNFQDIGTVNLKVCVDENGKVISAKPKLSGSTTQNSKLQKLAIANAKKYKFDKSGIDQQCGTITYKFQLQ